MASSSLPHLVLARKWRPDSFDELAGQEHVTRVLAQALRTGRIAHAFLFTGIRGVGKTTAARILARCLNCERGPTPEPCGECAACVEIRAGRALDVVELDGATYRKIDDARAIIEALSYRPARDRFRIYIIDEAHQLTDQAFNALLKTLEEPPAHIKFILATTEPQKMPETILSRLQRYDFRRIPFATIQARLSELARREDTQAEPGALALLAREAGGSMRDAERMLETAIALSPERVTENEVSATLGLASRERVYRLCEMILNRDAAAALATVKELHDAGSNLEALGRDLLEILRNLAAAKISGTQISAIFAGLPDHEAAENQRLAATASLRDLMRWFRLMAQAQEEVLRLPYPDLLLEMTVVRMATLAPVLEAEEILCAIKAAKEASVPADSSATHGPKKTPPSSGSAPPSTGIRRINIEGEVKADAPRKPIATAGADAPSLEIDLPELRAHIRAKKAPLAGFMEHGVALNIDGDTLHVRLRNDVYLRYLSDNRMLLAELAAEHFGREIAIELISAASLGASSVTQPAVAAPDVQTESESNNSSRVDEGTKSGTLRSAFAAIKERSRTELSATASEREEVRKALFADPVIRKVLDQFQGRLVEIRDPVTSGANTHNDQNVLVDRAAHKTKEL